jgi:hypothetical protein
MDLNDMFLILDASSLIVNKYAKMDDDVDSTAKLD